MRCLFLYSTGAKAHRHAYKQMSLNPIKGIAPLCIMLHNSYFMIILRFTRNNKNISRKFHQSKKNKLGWLSISGKIYPRRTVECFIEASIMGLKWFTWICLLFLTTKQKFHLRHRIYLSRKLPRSLRKPVT